MNRIPEAIKPPSAAPYPYSGMMISAGGRNAKLDPRYAGTFHWHTTRKISVPIPLKRRTVDGSTPRSTGTRTVAPNIASRCCSDSGAKMASGGRSSTPTTGGSISVPVPLRADLHNDHAFRTDIRTGAAPVIRILPDHDCTPWPDRGKFHRVRPDGFYGSSSPAEPECPPDLFIQSSRRDRSRRERVIEPQHTTSGFMKKFWCGHRFYPHRKITLEFRMVFSNRMDLSCTLLCSLHSTS